MDNTISIESWKQEHTPHLAGEARCLHCDHTWLATAPVGVDFLECPECHLQKGVFWSLVAKFGKDHWQCPCGNMVFAITPKATYCVKCGLDQVFPV